MAFIEMSGKSVDEAVAAALKELNVTADAVDVEVIQEAKKGFLGFFGSDAKVRVTLKEDYTTVAAEPVKTSGDALKEAFGAAKEALQLKSEEIKEKVEVAQAETKAKVEDLAQKARETREENKAKFEAKVEEYSQKATEAKNKAVDDAINKLNDIKGDKNEKKEAPAREPRRYVVTEEAVNAAREFLQRIFNAMKIEVVMEKFINKNDGSITFKLHGDDMGILIGKHGQTLDSLQYLTNLVANKNSSERVRVIIDVEDYRDRRVETLTRLANRLADKVKRTGERVALEPMNPHERKIIHMALQNDRRVTTLSEGDDPYRHVVIELKK